MKFCTRDLELLQSLEEKELYVLNRELVQVASEMKRSVMVIMTNEELICELVGLAETAAKEIACRKRWSPAPSNGKYSTNGITYDTREYREWLIANRDTVCDMKFLSQFSFWNDVFSLMSA